MIPYLEFGCDDVLETLIELGLLETGSEAGKGRVRKNCAFFRVEVTSRQCPDRIVMLTKFCRGSEVHASNRYAEFLRKLDPYCSSLRIGVGVVCSHDLSSQSANEK